MQISTRDWVRYIRRLRAISDKAAEEMQKYISLHGFENTDEILRLAYALSTKYGEAAGAAACEMYDAIAAAAGVGVPAAEPAATATYGEVAKAVNGAIKDNYQGQISQIVGRKVKQAGADTTLKNALRDGAEFAWIPHGDTCAFCITLASRGWQRASANALKGGHAEHIHSNCDCEYGIRFSSRDGVRGYDPDYYKRIYYEADPSGDSTDKVNAIRRQQYEKNKDKINAQKRAAYAAGTGRQVDDVSKLLNRDGVQITFDGAIAEKEKYEKARRIITDLGHTYDTRLQTVTTGAEKAAGDVDISGSRMRLNTSQETTVFHEFAHTLANSKADKYGLTHDADFWKEIRKINREYHRDVDAKQDVRRWISGYEHSSRDIDEFMCEAFAHAKARELGMEIPSKYGTDFTYSKKVLEAIDKHFKKKR